MPWYQHWFNTPYYHLLYSHRNQNEAAEFMHLLVKQLQIAPSAHALDVACGKGRHSVTLAQLGLNVTGIDLAENSICEAKKNEQPNLHFEVWDMRKPFKINSFNLVVNLFSSFGYFDSDADDQLAIKAMSDNLQKGGVLVLDYINTQYAMLHMKPREIINRGDIQFHIQKRVENGFIKKNIEFIAEGENHQYEEKLKVINLHKFQNMFTAAGLRITSVFGDYHLQPFVASLSPRLILVAQKE